LKASSKDKKETKPKAMGNPVKALHLEINQSEPYTS